MESKKLRKKDLINLISDKAVYLLEFALKTDGNAFLFRDSLSEMYNTSADGRMKLYLQFYTAFNKYYGKYISESKLSDPDYSFPFRLDTNMTESIENYISKSKLKKLNDLKQKLWDWSFENDKNEDFHDFYEVLLSSFHNDLYYLAGLVLIKENPRLLD